MFLVLFGRISLAMANITKKIHQQCWWIFLVGEDGFEPSKPKQQIYSLPPLTTRELSQHNWSWWTDSNPRPADYKSAALPTELHQQLPLCFISCRHHSRPTTFILYHRFFDLSRVFSKKIYFFENLCFSHKIGVFDAFECLIRRYFFKIVKIA